MIFAKKKHEKKYLHLNRMTPYQCVCMYIKCVIKLIEVDSFNLKMPPIIEATRTTEIFNNSWIFQYMLYIVQIYLLPFFKINLRLNVTKLCFNKNWINWKKNDKCEMKISFVPIIFSTRMIEVHQKKVISFSFHFQVIFANKPTFQMTPFEL